MTSEIACAEPLAKLRAMSLGTYLSCSIADAIFCFVSSEMTPF